MILGGVLLLRLAAAVHRRAATWRDVAAFASTIALSAGAWFTSFRVLFRGLFQASFELAADPCSARLRSLCISWNHRLEHLAAAWLDHLSSAHRTPSRNCASQSAFDIMRPAHGVGRWCRRQLDLRRR